MSIFKRGNVYWFHFLFNGEHIQRSTKQGNPRTARQMEAAHRTALAKGEVGIVEAKPAPLFAELANRFVAHIETRHENKPRTIDFYKEKLTKLLRYAPIGKARADRIDEGVIENYVVMRRALVCPATVNRELATLRRTLRLGHEWREINRVPVIRLLSGERIREFVLSSKQEELYLTACPQPLHDIALLMLETGLRIGGSAQPGVVGRDLEAAARLALRLSAGSGRQSKRARRIVPLTDRALAMLKPRSGEPNGPYVFGNREGSDMCPHRSIICTVKPSRQSRTARAASSFPASSSCIRSATRCSHA